MNPYEHMTTAPVKQLTLSLAVPSIISMMITTVYNMVDAWFVSKLGTQAVAAVGISFAIMEVINALGYLFGTGAGTRIGLLLGAKDRAGASQVGTTACLYALLLSAVPAAAGLAFLRPLMRFLGSSQAVLPYAEAYGRYMLLGMPVMCLSIVLSTYLRSEGKNSLSMIGLGCGAVLNMLLDPLFIFTAGLGVSGAALATFVSQAVSLLVLLSFFLAGRTETRISPAFVSRDPRLLASILRAGLPSLCRHGAGTVATASLNISAGIWGGDALIAALSIVSKVSALILALIKGLFQGAQSIYSYNKGAGRDDRIREAYFFVLFLTMVAACVIAAVLSLFAPQVMNLFSGMDETAVALGISALRWHVVGLIFMPFGFSMSMLLQATGSSGSSTLLALLPQALFYVPLVFLLPRPFGVAGIMMTPMLAYALTGAAAFPFWKRYFQPGGLSAVKKYQNT